MLVTPLNPGDAYRLRSGGGGGYGSPVERDLAAVRNDVRQGYVSVTAAREQYGVVIDGETFEIDEQATRELRERMRAA